MAGIVRMIKKTLRRRGSDDHRKEMKEEEMHKKHVDQAGGLVDKVKETQHLDGHGQDCKKKVKKKKKEKEKEKKETYNSSSSDDSD